MSRNVERLLAGLMLIIMAPFLLASLLLTSPIWLPYVFIGMYANRRDAGRL